MSKKSIYDFFIGLLALMLSLILVIEIFINIPNEVRWTFYYIDNIVRLIFIGDYFTRLVISKGKREFIRKNWIDLLSIFPIKFYIRLLGFTVLPNKINPAYLIKAIKFIMLMILVISTIFIVIGAVLISLVEGMPLGDALWWSFVTFTTVGYGDVLLKTQLGRTIAVLLMIIGIGIIGVITTTLTLSLIGGKNVFNKTYKDKVVEDVKSMLDNYDELTIEDIDNIARILKSLKE